MSKSTKPALRPVPKPVTEEEKNLQIARYLANEKKTYFQLILSSTLRNDALSRANVFNIKQMVDDALDGADYILTKLYPVEKKED